MLKLNTPEYPPEIKEEVQTLMNSRIDFLKTISTANAIKLEELYARLQTTWNLNNIETLEMRLNLLSNGLNRKKENSQMELENFKKQLRLKFEKSIAELKTNLEAEEQALQNLSNKLLESKETLNQNSIVNSSQTERLETLLIPEKEKLKRISETLNETLKLEREESRRLEKIRKPLQENLDQKTKSLNLIIENLLRELATEICAEVQNCPIELEKYLKSGELLTIIQLNNQLMLDIRKRGEALTTEITKIGMTRDEYIQKMEIYDRTV